MYACHKGKNGEVFLIPYIKCYLAQKSKTPGTGQSPRPGEYASTYFNRSYASAF